MDEKHAAFATALEELCAAHPLQGNVNSPTKLAGMQRVVEARRRLVKWAANGNYRFYPPRTTYRVVRFPIEQMVAIHALIYG